MWSEPRLDFWRCWWFSSRPCEMPLIATTRGSKVFSPVCRRLSWLGCCREPRRARSSPPCGLSSAMPRVAGNRFVTFRLAFVSLNRSEWANQYYRDQRAKGHSHHQALRALGAKWLKIIFVMWRDHKPYDENIHLANITRQKMRHAA